MIDRKFILEKALEITTGQREETYGGPENSFALIAELWAPYIRTKCIPFGLDVVINPEDVAIMMALLKVARLASNASHLDSWVDLAGYAACGGEIGCGRGGGYENAE